MVCQPSRRLPASSLQMGPSSPRWEIVVTAESLFNLGLFEREIIEGDKSKWEIGLLFPQTLVLSRKGMLRDIAGSVRSSTIVGTLRQRFSFHSRPPADYSLYFHKKFQKISKFLKTLRQRFSSTVDHPRIILCIFIKGKLP